MAYSIGHSKKDTRTKLQRQKDFLAAFEETGNVTAAAKIAKIERKLVYWWNHNDPKFAAKFEEATADTVFLLEDEAHRRAVTGVKKPVFQQGMKVGEVTEYSDTLLIVLLKARAPHKYKDRVANEITGENGKPLDLNVTLKVVDGPPLASSETEVDV